MSARSAEERDAIELAAAAVPGVRSLYPVSLIGGSTRVGLSESAGVLRCELRVAASRDVPAADLVRDLVAAVRSASGEPACELHVEVASID